MCVSVVGAKSTQEQKEKTKKKEYGPGGGMSETREAASERGVSVKERTCGDRTGREKRRRGVEGEGGGRDSQAGERKSEWSLADGNNCEK